MIVIFVSHKLEEVEELCSEVTVMRLGNVVGRVDFPVPTDRLVEMMFGKVTAATDRTDVAAGPPVLRMRGVAVEAPTVSMAETDFTVAAGEVVGLAGLEGSGQRAFLEMCAGLRPPNVGAIAVGSTELTGGGYRDFLEAGVHYLPAGRLEEGLVAGLTIRDHFVLADRATPFFVDWEAASRRALEGIGHYSIKGTPTSTAESLSGGNQQRLLLALMRPHLRLLLMEHPTRGLDIESADWVWGQILRRRESGTAIVFASADLDELLRYSDRIIVFFAGSVFKVVDAAAIDGDMLGHLIGGRDVA